MEDDKYKKCKESLMNEIEKEVEELLGHTINNAEEVSNQTEKLENISYNSEEVSHQQNVSRWYIDYISSTFGKIYKNINEYPIKKTTSNMFRQLALKTKIFSYDLQSKDEDIIEVEENTSLDRISNKLSKIKRVSVETGRELNKHNAILDYTDEIIDNASDKIHRNNRKINKILK
jgi:hypothetical protein